MNHYYVLLFLIILGSSIAVGLMWQRASDYRAAAEVALAALKDATEKIRQMRQNND